MNITFSPIHLPASCLSLKNFVTAIGTLRSTQVDPYFNSENFLLAITGTATLIKKDFINQKIGPHEFKHLNNQRSKLEEYHSKIQSNHSHKQYLLELVKLIDCCTALKQIEDYFNAVEKKEENFYQLANVCTTLIDISKYLATEPKNTKVKKRIRNTLKAAYQNPAFLKIMNSKDCAPIILTNICLSHCYLPKDLVAHLAFHQKVDSLAVEKLRDGDISWKIMNDQTVTDRLSNFYRDYASKCLEGQKELSYFFRASRPFSTEENRISKIHVVVYTILEGQIEYESIFYDFNTKCWNRQTNSGIEERPQLADLYPQDIWTPIEEA